MKNIHVMGCVLSLLALTASAQQGASASSPPQRVAPAAAAANPTVLYVSAAEMTVRIAKAQAAVQAGKPVPEEVRTTASWGPFQGHMGYRTEPQPLIYTNDDFAEYYSILDGEATMTMGGRLANAKRTGPHAESSTVQGAREYRMVKGDLLMVPPGVPHGISRVQGKLVYISIHLPLQPDVTTGALPR